MEIKILVPENKKIDLANFIEVCKQQGFTVTREGGGRLPNFSGYYAELKGERWQKADTGENNALLPDVSFSLRDKFAMMAISGLTSATEQDGTWTGNDPETVAEEAYKIADAMIKARSNER